MGLAGGAGVVVGVAFGGHAVGAVLGAGAAAFGHHGGAIAAVVRWWVGFGGGHAADGVAQAGEQQRAARGGDVGVSGRGVQDQCAVGELLFAPAPERLEQVMGTAVALDVADKSLIWPLLEGLVVEH